MEFDTVGSSGSYVVLTLLKISVSVSFSALMNGDIAGDDVQS